MNLEKGTMQQNLPTMVRLVRTGPGMYDILALRSRMVLAVNVSYLDAMSLCRRKGWAVSI